MNKVFYVHGVENMYIQVEIVVTNPKCQGIFAKIALCEKMKKYGMAQNYI